MKTIKKDYEELLDRLKVLIKWCVFAIITGIIAGGAGLLFVYAMNFVTGFREENSWTRFLLPLCGILIVLMYRACGTEHDKGTNMVITAIRTDERIKLSTTPLIFISTILTHLAGGSAGREGAALQFGGSLGEAVGRFFRFDEKDRKIIIMCGMSAAFSAVFRTPLAAVIFPMEVVSVGIMYYAALVPCVIASVTAHLIALRLGVMPEKYAVFDIPGFNVHSAVIMVVLAVFCAVISIIFCELLHKSQLYFRVWFPNRILRITIFSIVLIALMYIFGTDYNGLGTDVIERSVNMGEVYYPAFLLKILFTVITLGAGFKGGEIVPSFFIGATFGCMAGNLLGFSPSLCAAAGMAGVFCGVTNSPMTSLFISFELFGMDGIMYYLIVVAVTYMLSGYYSLYKSQKIVYSKTEPTYVNQDTE